MPRKQLGVIGVGGIAQTYLQVIDQSEEMKLAAICDVAETALASYRDSSSLRVYSDFAEMASRRELDAVIVCTPPSTHPDIVSAFLHEGIPVLCEKPLAVDQAGARRILQASLKSGTPYSMASKFRFVDDVKITRDLVRSGDLGDIILMENAFNSPVDMTTRWNSNRRVSGGGVLIDNGTHSVDIVRYILGPITDVLAISNTFTPNLKVEDNVQLFAHTSDGTNVRVDLSWTFDKQMPNYISIFGTHGSLLVGWQKSQIKMNGSEWKPLGSGYAKMAAFHQNLTNFIRAIDGKEEFRVSVADAMESVRVIAAAYQSSNQVAWMSTEPDLHLASSSV